MFTAAFEKNIECLENRFNQNGLEYYEALQQVLILAASKKNYDTELKKILGFYNNISLKKVFSGKTVDLLNCVSQGGEFSNQLRGVNCK